MLVLPATWINGVSEFQGEIDISRIGWITGTFKSVHIIKASTLQGCAQDGIPLCMLTDTHFDLLLPFLQVWHQVQHCRRPGQPVLSQPQFSWDHCRVWTQTAGCGQEWWKGSVSYLHVCRMMYGEGVVRGEWRGGCKGLVGRGLKRGWMEIGLWGGCKGLSREGVVRGWLERGL